MMKKRLLAGAAAVLATAVLAGCTAVGSAASDAQSGLSKASGQGLMQPEDKPVPQVNLITGMPLQQGEQAGTRPAAVMVSNIAAALPQRGISSADAVFEMETEGGITRLMALYANPALMPQVGPIRSARDQFLQFALPLNAVFVHIGSSVYAQNLLNQYAYQDIDGLYLGVTAFALDEERRKLFAQEHCWYTDAPLLDAGMQHTGIVGQGAKNTLFQFAQKPYNIKGEAAKEVVFMASPSTQVQLVYNEQTGTYLKTAYGSAQIDESTGTQLSFENAFILFDTVTMKPDGVCTNFALTEGRGYYFRDGVCKPLQWKKGDATEPLQLLDEQGAEIQVCPGKSYVAVVRSELHSELKLDGVPMEDAA